MTETVVLRSRFGSRAQALLSQSGRTARELATSVHLPVERVTRILEGRHISLTLKDMEIIALDLGAPLYALLAPAKLLNGETGGTSSTE